MTRISVLQLDTQFPRIAGDVGCAETFQCELEIIRIPNMTVAKVVTDDPSQLDLCPFKDALSKATGDLITTSCGFIDAAKFGRAHLPTDCVEFEQSIVGLDVGSHLRDVISNDFKTLDENMASDDLCFAFQQGASSKTKAVILECTNLPPYKPGIRRIKPIAIYDILTAIESKLPNSVNPQFL
jgi:hypothetical protein